MKARRFLLPALVAGALTLPVAAQADTVTSERGADDTVVSVSANNKATSDKVTTPTEEEPPSPSDPVDGEEPPSPGDPDLVAPTPDPVDPAPDPARQPEPKPSQPVQPSNPSKPSTPAKPAHPSQPGASRTVSAGKSVGSGLQIARTPKHLASSRVATLPATGATSDVIAGIGVSALVAGTGFVLLSRRQEQRSPKHLRKDA